MELAAEALVVAHGLYARANSTTSSSSASSTTSTRPGYYKIVGISLAIGSGVFIGTSFILKKLGLLKANEKYNEVAGDGYGYLKNVWWWSGMTLMIVGEICNFVAYAFTDAILVTPLGALSVVITTILSAIFLKERLSMVGKVACFLCIVGSVVIVMNAPEESSVSTIQEMQHFVIAPGFLSYAGVILVGSAITAFWAGPRWGKKNMLVYISICSWVGGLSVVATQGLGSAIVAQAGGTPQFNQWFLYVLFVFVICTLLTEIIYLNKALNLFNAALVTPTYYVYFTSTTIITSAVLFRGFKGTATSITTVVLGFLIICSGVVLLQLSKSAKDVPDAAVFSGDLDQIQTIAEQEQSETEPKADAIRGTAAIVRRFSSARQNMEFAELRRLREEKMRERLEAVHEGGQPEYEWDGLRRRRTTYSSMRTRSQAGSTTGGGVASGGVGDGAGAAVSGGTFTLAPLTPHPPLGWSHIPTEEELSALDRPTTPSVLSSIAGTIRGRGRSILIPRHNPNRLEDAVKIHSPMHPVQLTEISVPSQQTAAGEATDVNSGEYYNVSSRYGLPVGKTEYLGAAGEASANYAASEVSSLAPDPPPHSAKRTFSFQGILRKHAHMQHGGSASTGASAGTGVDSEAHIHDVNYNHRPLSSRGYSTPQVKGATEEERLGLVKGDTNLAPTLPPFEEEGNYSDDDPYTADKSTNAHYGRGITSSPPRRTGSSDSEKAAAKALGNPANRSSPPRPPPSSFGGGKYAPLGNGDGAFI